MVSKASRFGAGGVYNCRCCGRATRATGRGDNEFTGNCAECYDLGGEENSLSDSGEFYSGADNVLEMIEAVAAKGGKVAIWDDIKKRALAVQANIDVSQRELDMRSAQGEDVSGLKVSKRSGQIIKAGGFE